MIRSEAEYQDSLRRVRQDQQVAAQQRTALNTAGLNSEEVERAMEPLLTFQAQHPESIGGLGSDHPGSLRSRAHGRSRHSGRQGAWYFPVWEYPAIARFVIDHQIPIERLVTHQFLLSEASEAFRQFDQRLTEKAVFVWDYIASERSYRR